MEKKMTAEEERIMERFEQDAREWDAYVEQEIAAGARIEGGRLCACGIVMGFVVRECKHCRFERAMNS